MMIESIGDLEDGMEWVSPWLACRLSTPDSLSNKRDPGEGGRKGFQRFRITFWAISRPMGRDAVAAGDGALRTCRALSASRNLKSSTRAPEKSRAWALTPASPVTK